MYAFLHGWFTGTLWIALGIGVGTYLMCCLLHLIHLGFLQLQHERLHKHPRQPNMREVFAQEDTPEAMHTAEEYDDVARACKVWFAHTAVEGIDEISGTAARFAFFIRGSIHAQHWALVFDWGIMKRFLCELRYESKDSIGIVGAYLPYTEKYVNRYGDLNCLLATVHISPRQVCLAARSNSNKLNGYTYDVSSRSCQNWVWEMAKLIDKQQPPHAQSIRCRLGQIMKAKESMPLASLIVDFGKAKGSHVMLIDRALERMSPAEVEAERRPATQAVRQLVL
jgi:hypothetical protein